MPGRVTDQSTPAAAAYPRKICLSSQSSSAGLTRIAPPDEVYHLFRRDGCLCICLFGETGPFCVCRGSGKPPTGLIDEHPILVLRPTPPGKPLFMSNEGRVGQDMDSRLSARKKQN